MNEITLSTQMSAGRAPRLSVKMNTKALGVNWAANDIIRVMSYKEDGTIILKRVGKKVDKTVSYGLTKTGGGNFAHSLGLFITHRKTRFKKPFQAASNISAGARFLDEQKTMLQVYLPREIFH